MISLMSSPTSSPTPSSLHSHPSLLVPKHAKHTAASGPLYLLFPLPGTVPPAICLAHSFTPTFSAQSLKRPSLNIWINIVTSCSTLIPFLALFFFVVLFTNLLFNLLPISPHLNVNPMKTRTLSFCYVLSAGTWPGWLTVGA